MFMVMHDILVVIMGITFVTLVSLTQDGGTPLISASLSGCVDLVRLLLEKGVDVHIRDKVCIMCDICVQLPMFTSKPTLKLRRVCPTISS